MKNKLIVGKKELLLYREERQLGGPEGIVRNTGNGEGIFGS
jgi:hypothetical protein